VKTHTLQSLQQKLDSQCNYLTVIQYDQSAGTVLIKDSLFGEYVVAIASFAPTNRIPMHSRRRHKELMDSTRKTLVGKEIQGSKILEVFHGPEVGYKNRSIYLKIIAACGHEVVVTKTFLFANKKSIACRPCSMTLHGMRTKDETGALKKRTSTYNFWVRNKKKLPPEFQDFSTFRLILGDKPPGSMTIGLVNGQYGWIGVGSTQDTEIMLMAAALRQAFRNSKRYKECINAAKRESESSTKYECNKCKQLFPRHKVEVDHIDPIVPLSGAALKAEDLIPRIWYSPIQVLDDNCHKAKSFIENKERRVNKSK